MPVSRILPDEDVPAVLELEVVAWRYDCLLKAGYPAKIAVQLAESGCDLHQAIEIKKSGCPPKQALAILL